MRSSIAVVFSLLAGWVAGAPVLALAYTVDIACGPRIHSSPAALVPLLKNIYSAPLPDDGMVARMKYDPTAVMKPVDSLYIRRGGRKPVYTEKDIAGGWTNPSFIDVDLKNGRKFSVELADRKKCDGTKTSFARADLIGGLLASDKEYGCVCKVTR